MTGFLSGGVAGTWGAQILKNRGQKSKELRAERKRHLDDLAATLENMELSEEGTLA